MLAVHGFLAYQHAYSRDGNAWHAGDIINVALDETADALVRLRGLRFVSEVGLYGESRGGEHALLLAALMSVDGCLGLPDAVAAHAAADVVRGPFRANDFRSESRTRTMGPPSGAGGGTIRWRAPEAAQGAEVAWTWRGKTDRSLPGTPIEIEHYTGPVFLSHGTADELWSAAMTASLAARLHAAGRSPELHVYEQEGHRLGAEAQNVHNQLVVSFFQRHL